MSTGLGRKPATSSAERAPEMNPTALMRACGSKTGRWKPESPEHWQWMFENGEGEERALAWIKLHSVMRGSGFCVNAAGDPLLVAHMAADCGWKTETAANYCADLVSQGRVRMQYGKKIWYRADVPIQGRKEGERKSPVQVILPLYVTDLIRGLNSEKQARIEAVFAFEKTLLADGMNALRRIAKQLQRNTLLAEGIAESDLPPLRAKESTLVQFSLVEPAKSPVQVDTCTPAVQVIDAASILIAFEPLLRTPLPPRPFPLTQEGEPAKEQGTRAEGTNPRANGTNPRANGSNVRRSRGDVIAQAAEEMRRDEEKLKAKGAAS